MMLPQRSKQLAQSASALGAGILGFGIGAKWGHVISNYSLLVIVIGGIIHLFGMYIMQLKNATQKETGIAKALWISAWICLLALIAIVVYLLIEKKQ